MQNKTDTILYVPLEAMQHLSEHFFVRRIFYELFDVVTLRDSPCIKMLHC